VSSGVVPCRLAYRLPSPSSFLLSFRSFTNKAVSSLWFITQSDHHHQQQQHQRTRVSSSSEERRFRSDIDLYAPRSPATNGERRESANQQKNGGMRRVNERVTRPPVRSVTEISPAAAQMERWNEQPIRCRPHSSRFAPTQQIRKAATERVFAICIARAYHSHAIGSAAALLISPVNHRRVHINTCTHARVWGAEWVSGS
jgi:hypothetical protein